MFAKLPFAFNNKYRTNTTLNPSPYLLSLRLQIYDFLRESWTSNGHCVCVYHPPQFRAIKSEDPFAYREKSDKNSWKRGGRFSRFPIRDSADFCQLQHVAVRCGYREQSGPIIKRPLYLCSGCSAFCNLKSGDGIMDDTDEIQCSSSDSESTGTWYWKRYPDAHFQIILVSEITISNQTERQNLKVNR